MAKLQRPVDRGPAGGYSPSARLGQAVGRRWAKGPRDYDWLRIPLLSWQMPGQRWLLLRRRLTDGELTYYVSYVPPGTDLRTMVRVAGSRWTVEEGFAVAKGKSGWITMKGVAGMAGTGT